MREYNKKHKNILSFYGIDLPVKMKKAYKGDRDKYMAERIIIIYETHKEKIFVWAHNCSH